MSAFSWTHKGAVNRSCRFAWRLAGGVAAENSIGVHASLLLLGVQLNAGILIGLNALVTPVERTRGRPSKGDGRAVAVLPLRGIHTLRMHEECVLRGATFVAVVQAAEVRNRHDLAVVA
jgi:hypothetical protein